jgi:CRISPR-associated protein Cas1
VSIPFSDELREQTLAAVDGLRALAAGGEMPPPLEDSPKCPRCSLAPICLPDEVNLLANEGGPPRPLAVGRAEALPLYVQARGAKLAKRGEVLEITTSGEDVPAQARLIDISQVVLLGGPYITSPCLQELMRREIPVSWHTHGGWFLGHTVGTGHKNVELRTAQYRSSFDPAFCLRFARRLVWAKVRNARTLMRRNWRDEEVPEKTLTSLKHLSERALRMERVEELLGVEGAAAAAYFGVFGGMLKEGESGTFDLTRRNRRPPTDPVNALLSFAYAMLVRAFTMTLSSVGLDPYRGFYHQPRYGRPALALDLMEPFRPLIAESSVLQVVNNGEVQAGDFLRANGACALKPEGRKRFIAAFERRMDHEVTHPIFRYRVSYRRLIEVQARLLGRNLLGEIPEYPNFLTR